MSGSTAKKIREEARKQTTQPSGYAWVHTKRYREAFVVCTGYRRTYQDLKKSFKN